MDDLPNPSETPRARVDSPAEDSEDLRRIASGQRLVLYAMLAHFAAIALRLLIGPPGILVGLSAIALSVYGVVRLAGGLGTSMIVRVLLAVLMFVPLANLVALAALNFRATRRLREGGYRVGLMGASKESA